MELKHIHLFGTSMAAKSIWNLITKDSLWKRIIVQKYLAPGSMLDWIKKLQKELSKCLQSMQSHV